MGLSRLFLVVAAAVTLLAGISNAANQDPKFDYTQNKIRGVNLGGWLLLEPWITPSFFEAAGDTVIDEYTFGEYVGQVEGKARLDAHWSTWITEDDFHEIQWKGLNFVRIPIGYWSILPLDGDPYIPGAYSWLVKALDWAHKYSLKVIIDLHGAPLSQNGFDNSGRRGNIRWGQGNSIARTLSALNRLRDDFASHPAAAVFQLLNEPMGPQLDRTMLRQFMTEATNSFAGLDVVVAFHDAFLGVTSWDDWGHEYSNLLLDTHHYEVFDPGQLQMDTNTHVATACGLGNVMKNTGRWTIAGEWTTAMTDCAKWLNGRGIGARYDGTYNYEGETSQYIGSCAGKTSGTVKDLSQADRDNIRKFYEAQVSAFEKANGWFFWTWKTEAAPEWDFSELQAEGVIPHINELTHNDPCA